MIGTAGDALDAPLCVAAVPSVKTKALPPWLDVSQQDPGDFGTFRLRGVDVKDGAHAMLAKHFAETLPTPLHRRLHANWSR